jgi:hypothetical protein
MKKGSKEFYEVMDCFESAFKALPIRVCGSDVLRRSDRESSYFYDNGDINNLFLLYMAGHSHGASDTAHFKTESDGMSKLAEDRQNTIASLEDHIEDIEGALRSLLDRVGDVDGDRYFKKGAS